MPWPKGRPHTKEMKAKRIATLRRNEKRHKKPRKLDGEAVWQCPSCDLWLTADCFHADKRTPNGLKSQCRKCHGVVAVRTRDADLHRRRNRRSEARRRARKAKASGTVTHRDYEKLATIFGDLCLACGATNELQWDHVQPLSKGGDHSPWNLQRLCRQCNEIKQARTRDYRTTKQKSAVWVVSFKRTEANVDIMRNALREALGLGGDDE